MTSHNDTEQEEGRTIDDLIFDEMQEQDEEEDAPSETGVAGAAELSATEDEDELEEPLTPEEDAEEMEYDRFDDEDLL